MEAELVNYGALGVMVAILLLFAKQTIDRLIADRNRAEQQRDEVVRDVLDKVAPAITAATQAIKARDEHDSDIRDVLVDVRRLLERVQP